MLCVIWLDRKYCRWTCATATLYINTYLHRECPKTSFIRPFYSLFYCDRRKFNLTGAFSVFLFMVTSRRIFICSAALSLWNFILVSGFRHNWFLQWGHFLVLNNIQFASVIFWDEKLLFQVLWMWFCYSEGLISFKSNLFNELKVPFWIKCFTKTN